MTDDTHTALTPEAVAETLGVSTETVQRWRRAGHGPPVIKTGPRMFRYPRDQFDAWVAAGGDPKEGGE